MFIGITGPLCAGKDTIAQFLISHHGFQHISLVGRDHSGFNSIEFSSYKEMLRYVTERWLDNFVTCDVEGIGALEGFRKRPFFLMIAVESPITVRYQRFVTRCQKNNVAAPTLEQFVIQSDQTLFDLSSASDSNTPRAALYNFISLADLTILNPYSTLPQLETHLKNLDLMNSERLRPSWDTYFMHLSDLAARRSNCMKRRVGCILVQNRRIVATGYNGTPWGLKNCNQGGCQRCNEATPMGKDLDRCLCMHAEENALLEAGRVRTWVDAEELGGTVLYCNTCPCLGCATKIVQAGVKKVVYSKSYGMDELSAKVFNEAGVKLLQHSPPSIKLDMDHGLEYLAEREMGIRLEWWWAPKGDVNVSSV